jgi:hypothetical protein
MDGSWGGAILAKLGILACSELGLPVCLQCGYAVMPEELPVHLKNKHQGFSSKETLMKALDDCDVIEVNEAKIEEYQKDSLDRVQAVTGVRVWDGFQCVTCGKCVRKESALKQHFHDGVRATCQRVPVSSLFKGNRTHYMAIDESAQDSSESHSLPEIPMEVYLNQRQRCRLNDEFPSDPREYSAFLLHSKFAEFLRTIDCRILRSLSDQVKALATTRNQIEDTLIELVSTTKRTVGDSSYLLKSVRHTQE